MLTKCHAGRECSTRQHHSPGTSPEVNGQPGLRRHERGRRSEAGDAGPLDDSAARIWIANRGHEVGIKLDSRVNPVYQRDIPTFEPIGSRPVVVAHASYIDGHARSLEHLDNTENITRVTTTTTKKHYSHRSSIALLDLADGAEHQSRPEGVIVELA